MTIAKITDLDSARFWLFREIEALVKERQTSKTNADFEKRLPQMFKKSKPLIDLIKENKDLGSPAPMIWALKYWHRKNNTEWLVPFLVSLKNKYGNELLRECELLDIFNEIIEDHPDLAENIEHEFINTQPNCAEE